MIDAQNLRRGRKKGARSDGVRLAAHNLQRGKQGAANTGVVDVTHQADLQALEAALVLPDGVKVKQSLGGVIVLAVASADNACRCILAHDVRSARVLVAHDDAINLVCVERLDGIDQALALDRRGGRSAKVQAVGRKALLSKLKRAARARRGLVEHVDDGLALKGRDLLDGTLIHSRERLCGLENRHDIDIGILSDVDEVFMVEGHSLLPSQRS